MATVGIPPPKLAAQAILSRSTPERIAVIVAVSWRLQ